MRIRLETGGGYGGVARVADVDAGELTDVDVTAALAALDAHAAAPAGEPGPQPRYHLTVEADGRIRRIDLIEPDVPAAVRPLITELLARAGPARR